MSQQPSIGRIVHYCLGDEGGIRKGEVRPAIVVAMRHPELPNLQVLGDGPNDNAAENGRGSFGGDLLWRGSVPYAETPTPGCWNWPPRV